jgi:hypothetical protein
MGARCRARRCGVGYAGCLRPSVRVSGGHRARERRSVSLCKLSLAAHERKSKTRSPSLCSSVEVFDNRQYVVVLMVSACVPQHPVVLDLHY